jgi:hypothetical protein
MLRGRGREWFIAGALAGVWLLYDYYGNRNPVKVDLSSEQMSQREIEVWNEKVKKTQDSKKKD